MSLENINRMEQYPPFDPTPTRVEIPGGVLTAEYEHVKTEQYDFDKSRVGRIRTLKVNGFDILKHLQLPENTDYKVQEREYPRASFFDRLLGLHERHVTAAAYQDEKVIWSERIDSPLALAIFLHESAHIKQMEDPDIAAMVPETSRGAINSSLQFIPAGDPQKIATHLISYLEKRSLPVPKEFRTIASGETFGPISNQIWTNRIYAIANAVMERDATTRVLQWMREIEEATGTKLKTRINSSEMPNVSPNIRKYFTQQQKKQLKEGGSVRVTDVLAAGLRSHQCAQSLIAMVTSLDPEHDITEKFVQLLQRIGV